VNDALGVLSEASNHISAVRLQPNLGWMTQHLVDIGELTLKPGVKELLEQISVATVRRILQRIHQYRPRRRRASGFSNDVRNLIPMRRIDWNTRTPGHFEVELVFHCGPLSSGDLVYSLVMVDVATGWCECAAMLGKSYRGMRDAFQRCLTRCPVPAREVHTDNGSEFFSGYLLTFWGERSHVPELSRSRPYRQNDNRYVKHRNGALVRAWLGHDCLDTTQQTIALNRFYTQLWLYFDFFQPVQHLAQKRWTGHRAVRVHDTARTPFDRMVEAGALSADQTAALTKLRDSCNFC